MTLPKIFKTKSAVITASVVGLSALIGVPVAASNGTLEELFERLSGKVETHNVEIVELQTKLDEMEKELEATKAEQKKQEEKLVNQQEKITKAEEKPAQGVEVPIYVAPAPKGITDEQLFALADKKLMKRNTTSPLVKDWCTYYSLTQEYNKCVYKNTTGWVFYDMLMQGGKVSNERKVSQQEVLDWLNSL